MERALAIRYASTMVRDGYVLADMVAEILAPLSRRSFPKPFLLELSAICQIKLWEDTGLLPNLSKTLPSYAAAWKDMINRLRSVRNPYPDGEKNITLVELVVEAKAEVYRYQLAAESTSFLATMALTDDQLRLMADFLWDLRNTTCKQNVSTDDSSEHPETPNNKRGKNEKTHQKSSPNLSQAQRRETRGVTRRAASLGAKRHRKTRPID